MVIQVFHKNALKTNSKTVAFQIARIQRTGNDGSTDQINTPENKSRVSGTYETSVDLPGTVRCNELYGCKIENLSSSALLCPSGGGIELHAVLSTDVFCSKCILQKIL